jgi:uncharacterized repeat protein (TIGR01451 family)
MNLCGKYSKCLACLLFPFFAVAFLSAGASYAAYSKPYSTQDSNVGRVSPSLYSWVDASAPPFFNVGDDSHSDELWGSTGSEAVVVLVKDINPGPGDSSPRWLTNVDGMLFFSADDGSPGIELYKSDGTEAGTVLVKDIYPERDQSYLSDLINVNGVLFFSVGGKSGCDYFYELWKSDGTLTGTVMLKDLVPGGGMMYPAHLTNVNDTLFFRASGDDVWNVSGWELYKSDGTLTGTVLVKDINPGPSSSMPDDLTNVNGTLFFLAEDPDDTGVSLWKSDGTLTGTVRVKDISDSYVPIEHYDNELTDVNGTLFFTLYGLWKSDGTLTGTVRLKDTSSIKHLTNVNGTPFGQPHDMLFFSAADTDGDEALWKSDGTLTGTVRVKDINPGPGDSRLCYLTNVNGTLFFFADDGSGMGLYKSDGTLMGTVHVKDILPGWWVNGRSTRRFRTSMNGMLYLGASGDSCGIELWRSDGTPTGTVRVANINPGLESSHPDELTNVNGTPFGQAHDVLFFSAGHSIHGRELWALKPVPDLVLVQTVTPTTPILTGDPFTFTLSFSNVHHVTATGVIISDLLPQELTQVSVSHSGAAITCTPGLTYAWQVEDLGYGEGGVITISGVLSPVLSEITLVNTAIITSEAAEVNTYNNSSSTQVTVYPPALRVFKTARGRGGGPFNLSPNDVVTYTITLDNSLDELAVDVVMIDPLPAEVRFGGWVAQGSAQLPLPGDGGTLGGTGTLGGEVIHWGPWDIPSGEAMSVVFTATIVVLGSALPGASVVNTAWFSSTNAGSGSGSAAFTLKFMDLYLPLLMK